MLIFLLIFFVNARKMAVSFEFNFGPYSSPAFQLWFIFLHWSSAGFSFFVILILPPPPCVRCLHRQPVKTSNLAMFLPSSSTKGVGRPGVHQRVQEVPVPDLRPEEGGGGPAQGVLRWLQAPVLLPHRRLQRNRPFPGAGGVPVGSATDRYWLWVR